MSDALTDALAGAPVVGVMGGHALRRDEEAYAPAAPSAMPWRAPGSSSRPAAALARWRPRTWAPRARPPMCWRPPSGACGAPPGSPTSGRGPGRPWTSAPTCSRGPGSLRRAQHRHPDLVLRPRAPQRLLRRHREVLLERDPRGRAAHPGHGGRRRPRGCCGHRPGGLPGSDRALLRRPRPAPAALVLVGRRHWTETLPVWPALQALAAGRPMARHLHLVDDLAEAVDLLSP